MKPTFAALLALSLATSCATTAGAGEPPGPFTHRIAGLFAASRERAFRDAVAKIPGVKLVRLDTDEAEAVLAYDPAALFPGAKPDQVVQRLNDLLRSASNHTLGVKPPRAFPRERREKVEIAVAGLDCEACSLALYEIVDRLDGVDLVKASFHDGRVVAWIDPEKTDRSQLVDALKRRGVDVRSP